MRRARKLISLVTIGSLLAAPAASLAGQASGQVTEEVTVYEDAQPERVQTVTIYEETPPEPDGVSMAADFLVARPLGLVATVAGATIYILALPFAAMAGDIHTPAEKLVAAPARFTFDRPLGQIDL